MSAEAAKSEQAGSKNSEAEADGKKATEPEEDLEPWLKDDDPTYVTDAIDQEYVRKWKYRSYRCTIHIAIPHRNKARMFEREFPKFMAAEVKRKPEDFRVNTIINPYHPEDWEDPEDDDDPLYVQIMMEGDLRHINMRSWARRAKLAICKMDSSYIPGNTMVFFFGLHTKPLPSKSRLTLGSDDDDDY